MKERHGQLANQGVKATSQKVKGTGRVTHIYTQNAMDILSESEMEGTRYRVINFANFTQDSRQKFSPTPIQIK